MWGEYNGCVYNMTILILLIQLTALFLTLQYVQFGQQSVEPPSMSAFPGRGTTSNVSGVTVCLVVNTSPPPHTHTPSTRLPTHTHTQEPHTPLSMPHMSNVLPPLSMINTNQQNSPTFQPMDPLGGGSPLHSPVTSGGQLSPMALSAAPKGKMGPGSSSPGRKEVGLCVECIHTPMHSW